MKRFDLPCIRLSLGRLLSGGVVALAAAGIQTVAVRGDEPSVETNAPRPATSSAREKQEPKPEPNGKRVTATASSWYSSSSQGQGFANGGRGGYGGPGGAGLQFGNGASNASGFATASGSVSGTGTQGGESKSKSLNSSGVPSSKEAARGASSRSDGGKSQSVSAHGSGMKRVTTVQKDKELITITETPKKITVRWDDKSVSPHKSRSLSAPNAKQLEEKHPEAYAVYKEQVLDGAATGGGAAFAGGNAGGNARGFAGGNAGGFGDGFNGLPADLQNGPGVDGNPATRMLKEELKKLMESAETEEQKQLIEQMLRDVK